MEARTSSNEGIHRFTVGGLEAVVLSDGVRTYPLESSPVLNASIEEIEAALADTDRPKGHMRVEFNALAIKTSEGWCLIDTGNGPVRFPTTGKFPSRVVEAGIKPQDVATIVISHFHPDHINGLLTAENEPAFPAARITVPHEEVDFWLTDANDPGSANPSLSSHFANARRVFDRIEITQQFVPDDEVAPGIVAKATPGHTPGHSSFEITHGGSSLFVVGDALNQPALYAVRPDWQPAADVLKAKAVETRRSLLEDRASDRRVVVGYHFPFPGLGRMERHGETYRFQPLAADESTNF